MSVRPQLAAPIAPGVSRKCCSGPVEAASPHSTRTPTARRRDRVRSADQNRAAVGGRSGESIDQLGNQLATYATRNRAARREEAAA